MLLGPSAEMPLGEAAVVLVSVSHTLQPRIYYWTTRPWEANSLRCWSC